VDAGGIPPPSAPVGCCSERADAATSSAPAAFCWAAPSMCTMVGFAQAARTPARRLCPHDSGRSRWSGGRPPAVGPVTCRIRSWDASPPGYRAAGVGRARQGHGTMAAQMKTVA